MKTETMRKLGIICLATGIACLILAFLFWIAYTRAIFSRDFNDTANLFVMFACFAFTSNIGLVSVPLLIVSGVRRRREARMLNVQATVYCPYCGTQNSSDNQFCGKCGNRIA